MAYVNFKNSPSEETPLTGGATGNLNVMQENGTSHGADTKLGYAQSFLNNHIINVSNEVDEDYRVNLLKGNNLFKGSLFIGIINEGGDYSGVNIRITNANSTTMKTFILKKGTYTVDVPGLDYCAVLTKNESGTRIDDFADSWKALPFTFTTTQDAYIYISARKSDNSVLNPNDYSFILQEGSTIEPIQYNQIVVDNENYSDTLNVGQLDSRSRVNVLYSKNLINIKSPSNTINGLTYTINTDKSITITGTSTAQSVFRFTTPSSETENLTLEAGTYTIKATNKPSNCALQLWYSSSSQLKVLSAGVEEDTFDVSSNTTYENFRAQLVIPNGTTVNTTVYIMLYKGTEDIPYEPYITPSINVDGEEIYSKENTDIVDITNNITLASNWSIDSGKIYKQGKHIFGTIQIKTPSSLPASTNSQNVIHFPYTLASVYILGGFTASGDKWSITNGFAYMYISSAGYVTLTNSSTTTFFRLQIDIMEA